MKNKMTFTQVLESDFKYLIESLEHGSSDPKVTAFLKAELLEKTGYSYVD
jgi:hypothetical protein